MTEEWRDVPTWEGRYQVSNLGRVRSVPRTSPGRWATPMHFVGRILKPGAIVGGYLRVGFNEPGRRERHLIHRLVLSAFVGPCPEGMESLHLNDDPTDNRLANLKWGTHSENTLAQVRRGTHNKARNTHCPRGHQYDAIKRVGAYSARVCLTCRNNSKGIAA